jgi:hypothetical protein
MSSQVDLHPNQLREVRVSQIAQEECTRQLIVAVSALTENFNGFREELRDEMSSNPRKTCRTSTGRTATLTDCPDEPITNRREKAVLNAEPVIIRNLPNLATLQALFFTWYKDDLFQFECKDRDEKATL